MSPATSPLFQLAYNFHMHTESHPLIVMIHGLGCSKSVYNGAKTGDFGKYFEILAIDMLGHGDSPKPPESTYDIVLHARAITATITAHVPANRPLGLVCHSVGGAVGLFAAHMLPNPLVAFINLEGNLIGADCGLVSRRTASVDESEFINSLCSIMNKEMQARGEDTSDFLRCSPSAYHRTARSVVALCDQEEPLRLFETLQTHKAYIFGDANHDMPILQRLSDIPSFSISRSGHMMMLDNPREFYETLQRILEDALQNFP